MTDMTWTQILNQLEKKRYTGKRNTYFGKLKEQLDLKKKRKKDMELWFEIQSEKDNKIEESRTIKRSVSAPKQPRDTKVRKETDAFQD